MLHEGPVPQGLTLEELSEVRAKYIADRGWADLDEVQQSFIARDHVLKSFQNYDKVILWFEHDLYDQLQILQILDWLQDRQSGNTRLSIICTDQYLGLLTPDEILPLFEFESPINDSHLKLAKLSWAAFTAETPEQWAALLKEDTSALPFLEGAIVRMIEEYPNCRNGLSRTEQQALQIIAEGEKHPAKIFLRNQSMEAGMFLGDSSFWNTLRNFLQSSPPLVTLTGGKALTWPTKPEQELRITLAGKNLLCGNQNWLELCELNRWIGGVHLSQNNVWCVDSSDKNKLIRV